MSRFEARARAPIDPASLAFFRVGFGLILCVAALRYFANGWIDAFYVEPRVFFPYEGLEWLRPLPRAGMFAVYAALAVLGATIAAGFCYRASAFSYAALFTYTHLVDKSNYLNHSYLVSLLAMWCVILPLHRAASLDAWLRPKLRAVAVPASALWCLRAQVGLVYFFAGVAKIQSDWLVHAQPLQLWLATHADAPLVGPLLAEPIVAHGFSWAGMLFDVSIVPFLMWRRARAIAFGFLVLFHAATAWLFPIGIFPLVMTLGATLFFEPEWPRRVFRRVCGSPPALQKVVLPAIPRRRWTWRVLAPLALAYFLLQIALPLRVFTEDGNVLWHESGFRFGWRVMVMEKTGVVAYRLVERLAPGASRPPREWTVHASRELTRVQYKQMSTQPDMIVWFGRWLARRHHERGGVEVSVYADVWVSLNGRPAARLIDPCADLAREPTRDASRYVVPLADRAHPPTCAPPRRDPVHS